MIVLNDTGVSKEPDMTKENKVETKHVMTMEDMFRRELDAFCAYKEWADETTDATLEMALEEIMTDEYLHAKFLREYMIDKDMYTLTDSDPHERKFWKIRKKMLFD